MNDLLYYADTLVINDQPRAVIIYEGDNDIALGISPGTVLATFDQVRAKIHAALPDVRIYVLSIKPSISRWPMWPKMQEANRLLKSACDRDDKLTFIDIGSSMLGADGAPKADIFKADMLHMTDAGYRLWTEAVRPVLLEAELSHEAKP
jgi:lysophospholipase L1-like esterase